MFYKRDMNYLDITTKILIEKHLTVKLRISYHKLNIETGRYGKILRCDRIIMIVTVVIGPSGSTIQGVIVRVISKSDQCEFEVMSTITPWIVPWLRDK